MRMGDFFVDTSYIRKYVVVSASASGVVLRPLEDDAIKSYWMEFISGYISEPLPEDLKPTLHLTQLPPEVLSVDAYVDYAIEYPHLEVHYGDYIIDVSDRVSVNHPNPDTPGLYALDYMVSATGEKPDTIWRTWVSIDEVPLLRRVITPWNRENKTLADINRLIIEPQFNEALYEAGVPIYNFQQSNAAGAVSQFAMQRYKNARAFVKDGGLFVTGPQLPMGTQVIINGYTTVLRDRVISATFTRQNSYTQGNVVTYCGSDYYAMMDIPLVDIPNPENPQRLATGSMLPMETSTDGLSSNQYWVQGIYYNASNINLQNGEYHIDYLWSTIDVNGYAFKMDLLRAFPVKNYWGHYNPKYFYDYAPGDLVSIVKNNVVSLYQRNDTSIDEKSTEEAYRPGHYRNPHWKEVYSESNDTEVINPIIKPYTNATNAIVSKTYSAREESFRMYSNMVGIPTELVDLLGSKYSVILWAILYRTRETFPGIKAAMNAIGLDIGNLHRVYSSIEYTDSKGDVIKDVYSEMEVVKEIAKSVKADRIWSFDNGSTPEPDKESVEKLPPWISYSSNGNTVYRYDFKNKAWTPIYSFRHIGSDRDVADYNYSVNNRYYKADLNLLDRLSSDGVLDMDDGFQWIEDDYFSGISLALTQLLLYEVPIYVYLRLKIHLATVGRASFRGISNNALIHDAWGGFIGLKVYPGKLFNMATCSVDYYYPTVYSAIDYPGECSPDSKWEELLSYSTMDGYRYYSFNQPVYIRMAYPKNTTGSLYVAKSMWTSRFTIGCLGNSQSPGTDDYKVLDAGYEGFMDASMMDIPQGKVYSPDMYLCKGIVGCTLAIESKGLNVDAKCLQWNYIFDDPSWRMDETLKFADWKTLEGVKFIGNWSSTAKELKKKVARCASPDSGDFKFTWGSEDEPTLYVGGGVPNRVLMYDSMGYLLSMVNIPYKYNMVLDGNSADYLLRLAFN